jgi:hypothetical protein
VLLEAEASPRIVVIEGSAALGIDVPGGAAG